MDIAKKRKFGGTSCSAIGCYNRSGKPECVGISFHKFPKDEARSKLWENKVKRRNWKPSHSAVLCSAHFEKGCFKESVIMNQFDPSIRLLKPNALPTLFHPQKMRRRAKKPTDATNSAPSGPDADSGGDEGQDLFAHIEFNQWSSDEHDGKLKSEVKVVNRSFPIPEWPLTLDDLKNPSLCQMTENVVEYFNPLCTGRLLCLYYTAKNFEDHGIKASADDKGKRQETWYDILTLWMKIFCNSSGDCNAIRAKLKREVNKFETMKKCYNVRGSSKAKEVLWKYLDSMCTIPQSRVMTVDSIQRQNPAEAVDSLTKTEPSSCSHKVSDMEHEDASGLSNAPEEEPFEPESGNAHLSFVKVKSEPVEEESEHEGNYVQYDEDWLSLEVKEEQPDTSTDTESFGEADLTNVQNSPQESFILPDLIGCQLMKTNSSFDCEVCSMKFISESCLKTHMETHSNNMLFVCEVCNKTFADISDLRVHLKIHLNPKSNQCEVCKKVFSRYTYLIEHFNVHTKEKPYICEICFRAFSHRSSLNRHQTTHSKTKPFRCEICNKTFARSSTLKQHSRTHTNEKPYLCNSCDKSFADASTFKRHQRTHTNEKPYRCEICNKTFIQSANFKCHYRIHTKERPFSCEICSRAFTQSSSMKKHMKTHTMSL